MTERHGGALKRPRDAFLEKEAGSSERVYREDGVIMFAQASLMKLERSEKQETWDQKKIRGRDPVSNAPLLRLSDYD